MLTATLKGSYRSKKSGQKVYTYEVDCTPKEKAALKAAKGDYYRETETGIPLHFITEFDAAGEKRIIEPVVSLVITTNNLVVVDDTKQEQALMRDIKGHLAKSIADAKAAAWVRRPEARVNVAAGATSAPAGKLPSAQDLMNETGSNETANQNVNENVTEGAETIDS